MKRGIYYIGNVPTAVQMLIDSDFFDLQGIICEKGKAPDEMYDFAKKHHLLVYTADTKQDLVNLFTKARISLAVMYSFGIIIPAEITNKVSIFNFHPGSLKTNRGSSPVNWSILLDEKATEMTLYKISEKIDVGEVVAVEPCRISEQDIPSSLRQKMEQLIPSMLQKLSVYLDGNCVGEMITDGVYRRRIVESDYTIDLETDPVDRIRAKIRSQADYQGAIVYAGGQKIYIKTMGQLKKIAPEWKLRTNE